jgi:hypothetical protein
MEQLNLKFPPTKEDICKMCHWSTDCNECCKACDHQCNSVQYCGLEDKDDQSDRWEAILHLMKSKNHLKINN